MDWLEKYINNAKIYWIDLHQYYNDLDLIFYAEKRVIEHAEEFIIILKEELKSRVKNDNALNNKPTSDEEKDYQEQYYYHYYGKAEEAIEQVVQTQRKASVLSIYSLIEGCLKELCNLVQSEFDFKIKIDDLGGYDDIHKYLMYLQKVYEIDTTTLEPYYTPIKQRKFFRNKIAHNNSLVETGKVQQIRQTPGLKAHAYGGKYVFTIVSIDFNINLLTYSEDFFKKLKDLMEERYMKLKDIVD